MELQHSAPRIVEICDGGMLSIVAELFLGREGRQSDVCKAETLVLILIIWKMVSHRT